MDVPKTKNFESKISELLREAESRGQKYVDIISKELHRMMGWYPPPKGERHRMPACCAAMHNMIKPGDRILHTTPSGQSTTLRIRYHLPR